MRSTSVEPRLLSCPPQEADSTVLREIRTLAEQVEGTIGVICPTTYFAQVQQLVDGDTNLDAVRERLLVLTPLEVKGLEYDAVLVVAPDDIVAEFPGGIRILYVSLTRPTQRLVTLDINDSGKVGKWRAHLSN